MRTYTVTILYEIDVYSHEIEANSPTWAAYVAVQEELNHYGRGELREIKVAPAPEEGKPA